MPVGRSIVAQYTGNPISIIDDPNPEWKNNGATIAWPTVAVAAATAAVATPAAPSLATATTTGSIPPGVYLVATSWNTIYGETILGPETSITVPAGTSTNTITSTTAALPTNVISSNAYVGTISGNLTYVQTTTATTNVLRNLPRTGARGPLAAGTSGSADGSIVFPDGLTVVAGQKGLRFGQFMTLVTSGAYTGMYGPYDDSVSDGRQTITAGQCGFLDQTILQNSPVGLNTANVDNVGLVIGGRVYKGRLLATAGTHSLAAGPTFAEVLAALPRIQFVTST